MASRYSENEVSDNDRVQLWLQVLGKSTFVSCMGEWVSRAFSIPAFPSPQILGWGTSGPALKGYPMIVTFIVLDLCLPRYHIVFIHYRLGKVELEFEPDGRPDGKYNAPHQAEQPPTTI